MTGPSLLNTNFSVPANTSSMTAPSSDTLVCFRTLTGTFGVFFYVSGVTGYSGGTVNIRLQITADDDPNTADWRDVDDVAFTPAAGQLTDKTTYLAFSMPGVKWVRFGSANNTEATHAATVNAVCKDLAARV